MIQFLSLTRSELEAHLEPLGHFGSRKGKHLRKRLDSLVDSEVDGSGDELATEARKKLAHMRAKQLFQWVYGKKEADFDQMLNLAKPLRAWLKEHFEIYRPTEVTHQLSQDGTMKFLWKIRGGKTIESVIIPAALSSDPQEGYRGRTTEEGIESEQWKRLTACISSQVGCAMGCKFCITGIQGLDRNLETHEIIGQVLELRRLAPITNVVFMGMGEPLHNLENVIRACKILTDAEGLQFSKRRVTVSTSGIVPAMEALGKEVDVCLAVSLNGSNDEERQAVMPINKKWPISELLRACKEYPLGKHRKITFEYVMLAGINDGLDSAARVIELLKDIPSKVNLIPFNEHAGASYTRPSDEKIRRFQRVLLDAGLIATVRVSRGQDILAACGQLKSVFGTARGTEKQPEPLRTAGIGIEQL